jgi:hypothetical protein
MSASKIQRSGLTSWDMENMIKAIKVLHNKQMGYLAAAKKKKKNICIYIYIYILPRFTLCDYVRSNWDPFQATQSKLGHKPIIPPALEGKLVEYLLSIEWKYFRCMRDDVRRLAFHLAVQNKMSNPFSIAKEAAGRLVQTLYETAQP